MSTKVTPAGKVKLREKTPGPHGITLEMRKIKRAEPVVVHEHAVADHTAKRYKLFGAIPNRAGRRGMGKARRVITPRATLTPFEKA